jgi:hypothetical protein
MVVPAIDHGDPHRCPLQASDGVKPGESSTEDDDVRNR